MITTNQLQSIVGSRVSASKVPEIVSSIIATCIKYQINTPLRLVHFLSQILHESGCFKYVEEIASGDAYDTRTDLGNTPAKDGDGRLYKGRGYIQVTGHTNYVLVSKALGYDFIKDPEMLEKAPYNMLSAGWYWDSHNLNKYADANDTIMVTRKINGGLNGLAERTYWLNKCKAVLIVKPVIKTS